VLHPHLSLCNAAGRLSLKWLGQGGGLSGLGGGGEHGSMPHDSTQGRAEHKSNVHQLSLSDTYEHNCTFTGQMELAVKRPFSLEHTRYNVTKLLLQSNKSGHSKPTG
jgi:hypothetical protein